MQSSSRGLAGLPCVRCLPFAGRLRLLIIVPPFAWHLRGIMGGARHSSHPGRRTIRIELAVTSRSVRRHSLRIFLQRRVTPH